MTVGTYEKWALRQRVRRMALYVGIALAVWALAFGCYLVSRKMAWLMQGLLVIAGGCIASSVMHNVGLWARRGYRAAKRDANMKPFVFALSLMILAQGILIGRASDVWSTPKLGLFLFWPIFFSLLIFPMVYWKEWSTGEYFKRADAQPKQDA
ncbi:MAG: hypothetical protein JW889_10435 [Verrucomicrobia bacterium]|nr:hypothetical protein [Verrucomicrobiota bacterium]